MKLGIGLTSTHSGRKNSVKKVKAKNSFANKNKKNSFAKNKMNTESNLIHIPFSSIFLHESIKIDDKEKEILIKALEQNNKEIVEPSKDDNETMSIIVNLYKKKLVYIDFEQDKLFVSEKALSILNQIKISK